jgi:hypothetical protein
LPVADLTADGDAVWDVPSEHAVEAKMRTARLERIPLANRILALLGEGSALRRPF